MMDWVRLDDNRLIKHAHGFIVVKPVGSDDPTPIFCDVCGFANLTVDDVYAYRENGCCSACTLRWVDVKREGWAAGWRPDPDEVARERLRRSARPPRLPF